MSLNKITKLNQTSLIIISLYRFKYSYVTPKFASNYMVLSN